jgi:hypothetical protein
MLALALATLAGCAEAAGEGELDAAVADAAPGVDADPGAPDADPGPADAALADAAIADAAPGSPDARPTDASVADASVADARPPDASPPDAAPLVLHWEFQDGVAPTAAYAGTTDTQLFQNQPTTNFGAADSINVDGDEPWLSNKDVRGLVRWDVSAIPRTARVDSARVFLTVTNGGGATFTVRAMSTPWREREATWNERSAGVVWATAGGSGAADRAAATLATFAVPDPAVLAIELNAAGVAAVQAWIANPDANHGVMLSSDTGSLDGMDFHARDALGASNRPRLVVDLE